MHNSHGTPELTDSISSSLSERFEQFGALEYVSVVKDKVTGTSRGFGYVKFFQSSHCKIFCFRDYRFYTRGLFQTANGEVASPGWLSRRCTGTGTRRNDEEVNSDIGEEEGPGSRPAGT